MQSSSPPFTSIELDHSDSGREGCTVTTLTVSAEPKSWQGAIKVAAQEVCTFLSIAYCINMLTLSVPLELIRVCKMGPVGCVTGQNKYGPKLGNFFVPRVGFTKDTLCLNFCHFF